MPKNVLVVGGLAQDIYLSQIKGVALVAGRNGETYNQIKVGEHLIANEIHRFTGGTAGNVALALTKWGFEVSVMAPIGQDGVATQIMRDLDASNVNMGWVQASPNLATACNFRLYDRGNSRQSTISYLPNWSEFDLKQVNFFDQAFEWAYVSSVGGDFGLLDNLFRQLRSAGRKILFNPSVAELSNLAKCWGLFEDVSILLVDREEAEMITEDTTLDGSIEKLTNFVEIAVVTDAEDGVIVSDGESVWRAGVYQKVLPVDRTGVGDAFGAGFFARYLQSNDISLAINYGSANASSVIGQLGGQAGTLEFEAELSPLSVRERSLR